MVDTFDLFGNRLDRPSRRRSPGAALLLAAILSLALPTLTQAQAQKAGSLPKATATLPMDAGTKAALLTVAKPYLVKVSRFAVSGGDKPGDTVTLTMGIDTSGDGTRDIPWSFSDGTKVIADGIEHNVGTNKSIDVSATYRLPASEGVVRFQGTVDAQNTLKEPDSERANNVSQVVEKTLKNPLPAALVGGNPANSGSTGAITGTPAKIESSGTVKSQPAPNPINGNRSGNINAFGSASVKSGIQTGAAVQSSAPLGNTKLMTGVGSIERAPVKGTVFTVFVGTPNDGTISPVTAQLAPSGSVLSYTITPNAGHATYSVDGCGGTLNPSQAPAGPRTYTTGPITADCTVRAVFKTRSPQISSFRIQGGGETISRSIILFLLQGAGRPTQYQVSENANFTDATWQALAPDTRSIPFNLSDGDGLKKVYFQLQDSTPTGGLSAVVNATVTLKTRQTYTIAAGDFLRESQNWGFITTANKLDPTSRCVLDTNRDDDTLRIEASSASRCDFTLFGNASLKNNFIYKRFDGEKIRNTDKCDINLMAQPNSGSTSVQFLLHGWSDPESPLPYPLNSTRDCRYRLKNLTLEGPAGADWKNALKN